MVGLPLRRWLARSVSAAALALASLASHAAEASPCADADALVRQDHLLEAEAAYAELVKQTASQACARQGLLRTAGARCEAAERLLRARRPEEARKAYDEVLQDFPTLECALAGVERIAQRVAAEARSCETADALATRGLDAAAKAAYDKVLEAAPGAECALAGLERQAPPSWVRRARRAGDRVAAPALAVLAQIAGLALVAWLFIRWVRLVHPWSVKLDMDKVSAGSSGLDAGPCEQIMTLIEHELTRLGRRPRFAGPTLIDGPVEPPSLPELTSFSKGANAVWNVLLTLVPAKTASLSAVLLDDGGGSVGLGLRLVYLPTKELWGSAVLGQADLGAGTQGTRSRPDPSAGAAPAAGGGSGGSDPSGGKPGNGATYARLARAAAAWACWKFHERRKHGGKPCHEVGCTEMRRAFGTASWLSYAAAQLGAGERTRDPASAKRALRLALVRDPDNRLALYNFAALEVTQRAPDLVSNEGLYERLRARFAAAQRGPGLERKVGLYGRLRALFKKAPAEFDPIRVFSDFHLGAIAVYRHFGLDPSDPAARLLLEAAAEHFEQARIGAAASEGHAGEVELDSLIARAACLRMLGRAEEAGELVKDVESRVLSATALYNLACFYSNPDPEAGSTGELERASRYLEEAFEANPSLRGWAAKDPSLRNLRRYREHGEEPPPAPEAVANE